MRNANYTNIAFFNLNLIYSCSFECFKKHKEIGCSSPPNADELTGEGGLKLEQSNKKILQFTTDDTVHPDRLAELGKELPVAGLIASMIIFGFPYFRSK